MQPSIIQRLAAPRHPWPDRPVAIAFVITDLDVGGAERALTALVTRLDRRRWQPSVFCLSEPGVLAAEILAAGIPCECLAVKRRRPLQAVARLARHLRSVRPQIVQSFLFHANIASRLAALGAGRPWVVGSIRVAERRARWHLTLDRLTSRLSTGSVCVSEGVLQFSRDIAGLHSDRLTVIPNGIDPAAIDAATPLDRRLLGIPADAHLALYVGRLDPQKGLPDLLEAAETVIASQPSWHLLLVGDGPERGWLQNRLATTPQFQSRVQWLGRRDDVPSLLKTADLLVLPSHWEGMPNVILEAMAAHLPVVATAVEGTQDLILDRQTGWLIPPGQPTELARALTEAVHSPDACTHFALNARQRIEQHFSMNATVNAYEQLWARILAYSLSTATRNAVQPA